MGQSLQLCYCQIVLYKCQFVICKKVAIRRYKLIYVVAEILFTEMCEHKELLESLNSKAVGVLICGI
jgi:hypothetical protein